jgi:hypothetical protein
MGYSFPVKWTSFLVGTSRFAEIKCLDTMLSRLLNKPRGVFLEEEAALKRRIRAVGFLVSSVAKDHPFFSSFWPNARLNHGVAPRRDYVDLKWRFWCNPYRDHFTYILDTEACSGYLIFSLSGGIARLEDYAVMAPSEHCYAILFEKVRNKLAEAGVRLFSAATTDDTVLSVANRWLESHETFCYRMVKKFRRPKVRGMPRCITAEGIASGLDVSNWAITGLVFEGR